MGKIRLVCKDGETIETDKKHALKFEAFTEEITGTTIVFHWFLRLSSIGTPDGGEFPLTGITYKALRRILDYIEKCESDELIEPSKEGITLHPKLTDKGADYLNFKNQEELKEIKVAAEYLGIPSLVYLLSSKYGQFVKCKFIVQYLNSCFLSPYGSCNKHWKVRPNW